MKPFPNSVVDLLEDLERQYPVRSIKPTETRPEADHYAGKAELVVELRRRYEASITRDSKNLPKVL